MSKIKFDLSGIKKDAILAMKNFSRDLVKYTSYFNFPLKINDLETAVRMFSIIRKNFKCNYIYETEIWEVSMYDRNNEPLIISFSLEEYNYLLKAEKEIKILKHLTAIKKELEKCRELNKVKFNKCISVTEEKKWYGSEMVFSSNSLRRIEDIMCNLECVEAEKGIKF